MYSALLLAALLTPEARLAQAPSLPQAPLARELARNEPGNGQQLARVKSCPCSSLCTCGCNDGEPCTCASVAGPSVSRAVPVWPVQPAATWAPSYAPAPAFRAFSLPFSGGRSGGC